MLSALFPAMKIAELRNFHAGSQNAAAMRGTDAQDVAVNDARPHWRKFLRRYVAAGAAVVFVLLVVWLANAWSDSRSQLFAERIKVVEVTRGTFVRDVAGQGTVIAAISPTLFAVAPGTIGYHVRPGDVVKKGQKLATLDSPALRNDYDKERATLDGMTSSLARQEIEIRRQILASKQKADLADVTIRAAERELKRSEDAWQKRVISERDYQRAVDDVATAKLNFEQARDNTTLERESLALDLRTQRLEHDRQALVVENLKRRVDELTVVSPVDGMVANLAQAEKASLPESAPLLTVVDLSAFEIEFQVAETYAREIKPGMSAEITLDGKKHAGTVTSISPEVRQSQVTGRVKFASGQPAGLRQNQRSSVRIVLDERSDVLKFERGSFVDEATTAMYLVRDDRAVRTPVQLGSASVSEIEVIRGLNAGDRVIVSDMRDSGDAPELAIVD
jgi:HlyD family secretion protein